MAPYQSSDLERARSALSYLKPENRDVWVRAALAIKSEFGDAGFEMWDAWGSQAENHSASAAKSTWKSSKVDGKVTIATLFYAAKQAGWTDDTRHHKPTPEELSERKKKAEQHAAQAAAEEKQMHERAAATAAQLWEAAEPAEDHPYLKRKRVKAHGLRVGKFTRIDQETGEVITVTDQGLLVPMRDRKRGLHSLQCIHPSQQRQKLYLQGGAKSGHFHGIGERPLIIDDCPVFILAEGYATAASVHEATGHLVLACFDLSNLLAVAQAVREYQSKAIILLAADNDQQTDGNPGMTTANKVAEQVRGLVAVPTLSDSPDKNCDFNDLHQAEGLDAVRTLIESVFHKHKPDPPILARDHTNQDRDKQSTACLSLPGASLTDFWAHLPSHQYIFVPTRELWPASSVNGHLAVKFDDPETGKKMSASDWLDKHRAVQQITWHPGRALIVQDEIVSNGGWTPHAGAKVFNMYQPAQRKAGTASQAEPWLAHLKRIYPNDYRHILSWLAHRIQHPGVKINHALVLGGGPGIGKDTLLHPVLEGVGPWNCSEVSPTQVTGSAFNPWVKCVVVRISELRDLKKDRVNFYETMKVYTAAPPDTLSVNQKHMHEYYVPNVMGVLYTTNNLTDGLYLPADDRRHYVAWSDARKEDFSPQYWVELWAWLGQGGAWHVVEYLNTLDLAAFDAKAPPPKTSAFWVIVQSNGDPDLFQLSALLEQDGAPRAMILDDFIRMAQCAQMAELASELGDKTKRRSTSSKLHRVGYVAIHNPDAKDGLWVVGRRRIAIYARNSLPGSDQLAAARTLVYERRRIA